MLNNTIAVVILNFITYEDTINLVEELQYQSLANDLYILIVDNASPNNSFKHLKPLEKKFSNVKVLQTDANLGYARGNNFGLDYLDQNIKPEYIAILNNDIILPKDSFEKLIDRFNILDKPALIAPKQLDIKNIEVLPFKLNTFFDDFLNLFLVYRLFKKSNLKFIDNTSMNAMKVDIIPGSFMFSSFKIFKNIGFFYPNTFLFSEERFLAIKVKQLNLNNYVLLDETYIHAHSKTINTVFNQVGKYKLMYDGWLEFNKLSPSFGKIKTLILIPFMKLSLLEIKLIGYIRQIINNFKTQ